MTVAWSGVLDSVELEIERKLASMLCGPGTAGEQLLKTLDSEFPREDLEKVRLTLDYLNTVRSHDATHPSFPLYLSHPLRVALFAFRMHRPRSVDTVLIGLLHNVYEVAGLAEADLSSRGYSDRTARAVRLLTIDRHRETDPAYLAKFYGQIEAFGDDLALIRCVDKLDNLWATELLEDSGVRSSYIDLAEQFVAPMADRLAAGFGQYFRQTITTMRNRPFRPDLKAEHDRLLAAQLEAAP